MLSAHRRKIEQMERYRKQTNCVKFAEGLLFGTALGLITGLLLAPKSGRETLEDIQGETMRLVEKSKNLMPKCCEREEELELPEPDDIEYEIESEES